MSEIAEIVNGSLDSSVGGVGRQVPSGGGVHDLTNTLLVARTAREEAGEAWRDNGLVFATRTGRQLDAANVRREFRTVVARAEGLNPKDWTPRELRHSFVSLLSDGGMPLEQISRLVGHSGTTVTEQVYRKQIRPVIQDGAAAMDHIFPDQTSEL
jgi:site-specific recombinase XerD